jgi:hypothetical protein
MKLMRKPIKISVIALAVTIAGATIAAKTIRQTPPKMEMGAASKTLSHPMDNQTVNPNTQGTIPFAPPPMPGQYGGPQRMPNPMMGGGMNMGPGMMPMMNPVINIPAAAITTARDGSVYVLRGNTLYKYSADLNLQKSVDLPSPQGPQTPQPGLTPMQNRNVPGQQGPMGAQ